MVNVAELSWILWWLPRLWWWLRRQLRRQAACWQVATVTAVAMAAVTATAVVNGGTRRWLRWRLRCLSTAGATMGYGPIGQITGQVPMVTVPGSDKRSTGANCYRSRGVDVASLQGCKYCLSGAYCGNCER